MFFPSRATREFCQHFPPFDSAPEFLWVCWSISLLCFETVPPPLKEHIKNINVVVDNAAVSPKKCDDSANIVIDSAAAAPALRVSSRPREPVLWMCV